MIKLSKDSIMIVYAGIQAFSMVQLFNWFPRRLHGSVIALFLTFENVGFAS